MEYCSVHATKETIEASKKIVADYMLGAGLKLNDKEIELLTKDIMETSAMMGGDYDKKSLEGVCQEYLDSNFYPRFLKLHRKELGEPLFRF